MAARTVPRKLGNEASWKDKESQRDKTIKMSRREKETKVHANTAVQPPLENATQTMNSRPEKEKSMKNRNW